MSFRLVRRDGDGGASRGDPVLEVGLARLLVGVSAEPVAGARELPRGLEVFRIPGQPFGPDPLYRQRENIASAATKRTAIQVR